MISSTDTIVNYTLIILQLGFS